MDGSVVGKIGAGWLVLLGAGHGDTDSHVARMADKAVKLRMFEDEAGKFNLSALDVGAEVLVVSQFTLYADTSRGRRPSFVDAADPEVARGLVEKFAEAVRGHGLRVQQGVFGAHMEVELVNDGPVTINLEVTD